MLAQRYNLCSIHTMVDVSFSPMFCSCCVFYAVRRMETSDFVKYIQLQSARGPERVVYY